MEVQTDVVLVLTIFSSVIVVLSVLITLVDLVSTSITLTVVSSFIFTSTHHWRIVVLVRHGWTDLIRVPEMVSSALVLCFVCSSLVFGYFLSRETAFDSFVNFLLVFFSRRPISMYLALLNNRFLS